MFLRFCGPSAVPIGFIVVPFWDYKHESRKGTTIEPLFYVHEGLPLASFGLSKGIGARGLRRSLFRVWVLGLGIGIFTFYLSGVKKRRNVTFACLQNLKKGAVAKRSERNDHGNDFDHGLFHPEDFGSGS